MQAGPDIGGGIQNLMQQFMMYKLISQMYPGGDKEGEETLRGMPKIGEMFQGETQIPPGEDPMAAIMSALGGQQGQPGETLLPPQQPQGIQQILQMLQMLGGIPGLMK